MIPKWLYNFNHYLMIASLALYLLTVVASVVAMPFMKSFSREFVEWLTRFYGWTFPSLLAVFALSSAVYVCGFSKHRIKREDEEEKKD